jgi:MraZ protein
MSFDGTAEHTLDAKNRLSVPTRFRSSLSGPIVVAKSTERCISIWPKESYDDYRRAALEGLNPMGQKATKMKRFFAANALSTELDGTGRVGLPQFLVEHANLDREVTVIGADDHVEIWDRKAWLDYNNALTADVLSISEGLDDD